MSNLDSEKLKIPAYLRKKGITTRAKQQLILTALDRKNAGLSPKSRRALAPIKAVKKSKVGAFKSKSVEKNDQLYRFLGTSRDELKDAAKIKTARLQNQEKENYFFQQDNSVHENFIEAPKIQQIHQTQILSPYSASIKLIPAGKVVAYYAKIQVAIIHLESTLRQGDIVQLTSQKFLFQQPIESMQIDRQDVDIAKKGADIGLKVAFHVENNTPLYKIIR